MDSVPESVLDFNPNWAAQQLTLISHNLLVACQPNEFKNQAWVGENKEQRAPNILKIIAFTNKVTDWVVSEVLSQNSLEKRVMVLEWFLDLGHIFLQQNNYDGVFNILGGLSHTAVFRLTDTWTKVNPKKRAYKEEFDKLFSLELQDWADYKSIYEKSAQPSVPCMFYLLTCLVSIDATQTDSTPHQTTLLTPMFEAQKVPFDFKSDKPFHAYWEQRKSLTDQKRDAYTESYKIQERRGESTKVKKPITGFDPILVAQFGLVLFVFLVEFLLVW